MIEVASFVEDLRLIFYIKEIHAHKRRIKHWFHKKHLFAVRLFLASYESVECNGTDDEQAHNNLLPNARNCENVKTVVDNADDDEECTCGNIGCSETRCSGKRLEYLAERYFPDVSIREVFKYHGNSPIILKFVKDLAIPIATEINILDPDYSIIAGGVTFMEGFPKDVLLKAVHEKVRKPYPEENLEIMFTEHDQQSGIYGSGIYAHQMLKNII